MIRFLLAIVSVAVLFPALAEANGGLAVRQRVVTRQRIVQPVVRQRVVVRQQVVAQPYYQQAVVQQVVAQPVYAQAVVAQAVYAQPVIQQQVQQSYCAPSGGLQLRQQILTPSCQQFYSP